MSGIFKCFYNNQRRYKNYCVLHTPLSEQKIRHFFFKMVKFFGSILKSSGKGKVLTYKKLSYMLNLQTFIVFFGTL